MPLMANRLTRWGRVSKSVYYFTKKKITMQLQLLKGAFSKTEAIALISQLVEAKIKFHEQKIDSDSSEEQIKMREGRIKELQQQWKAMREAILAGSGTVEAEGMIEVGVVD